MKELDLQGGGYPSLEGYLILRPVKKRQGIIETPIIATFAPTETASWRIARGLAARNFPELMGAQPSIRWMKEQGFSVIPGKLSWTQKGK